MWKTAFKKLKGYGLFEAFFKGCLPQILLGPFLNTMSHMILEECKQIPEFPVMSTTTLFELCRKLGFCYEQHNEKYKCINGLLFILLLQPATLLKTRLRRWFFFCEFCKFFQTATLLKTRISSKSVFLSILQNF